MKPAEDGDGLILRVYEPAGARGAFSFRLPPGWRDAGAVDILEEASEPKAAQGLTPFEIRSWRLAPELRRVARGSSHSGQNAASVAWANDHGHCAGKRSSPKFVSIAALRRA